jgi:L-rhamnose-H+ transport protein
MASGVALSILAGIMLGAFAVPMKKVKIWGWEHTWLAFSVFALIVMPFLVALATIPDLFSVWKETRPATLLTVAGFAALWGVASMGYGLAVKLAGIAIANAVVLGLNNAIGSIVPIAVYTPQKLQTAAGIGVTAGVLVMILGIGLCARAGYLRDLARRPAGGENAAKAESRKGLIICLVAGVMGAAFNFALISGKPIEAIAVAHGAAPSSAPNATWPIALTSGCLVAIIYCVYLMMRRKNGRNYFAPGSGINWLYAVMMAVLWYGGVMIYGNAVTKLGELGASVGWAVLQSMTVATGAVLGFITGEWRSADRRIVGRLIAGLICLIAGIVIVVTAGTL